MLFPARDKRPLEFDMELTSAKLLEFARENAITLREASIPLTDKPEL